MDNQKDKIQISPGEVKAPPEDKDQPPIEEVAGIFRTTSATYDDLDPHEVRPFTGVPDYLDPTLCPYPLVVESDGIYHCIDGWEAIQGAIREGKDRITCDVSHIATCSETELFIRKAAARSMPKGGVARYAELIRNTRIIKGKIISSMEDPVFYSNGGARRGEKYTNNQENNVRLVVAERLGKSTTTISFHLSYAEYLTDEALAELAQGGADKEFFEKAQVVKRRIVDDLIDSNTSKEEITAQVSEAMLQMHRDPQEIENRKNALFHGVEEATSPQESPPAATQRNEGEKQPQQFKHWAGAQPDSFEANPTEEEIRRRGAEIAGRIQGRFQDTELSSAALKEGVTQDLRELASLIPLIKVEQ